MCFMLTNEIIDENKILLSLDAHTKYEDDNILFLFKEFSFEEDKLISTITDHVYKFDKKGWTKPANTPQPMQMNFFTQHVNSSWRGELNDEKIVELGYHANMVDRDADKIKVIIDNTRPLLKSDSSKYNFQYYAMMTAMIATKFKYVQLVGYDEVVVEKFRFPTKKELDLISKYIKEFE